MAALMSRLWLLRGCGLEALALLEAAAIPPDAFRLRVLASLGLHATFIEVSNRSNPPARLAAALGRARLETGDKAGALPVLLQALGRRSGWGAWLDAATALAAIDPERPAHALRGREREPVAALLLAHLAERAGDAGRAVAYLRAIGAAAGFQAEAGLLRANIAAAAGDHDAAALTRNAALARFDLGPFEAPVETATGPMVSVIIAAFDAESTIADSVRSLLRQSWGNLEVILVDDGGRDEGVARAHKVAEGDKRLRIIRMPTNSGAYVARNAGLAAATGRFVAFHDADDIAHPERIARQVAPLLVDGSLVATTARWIRCDDLARTRDRRILPAIRLHTGSVLVRRNFERAVLKGFDPVRFGADGDLLARLKLAAGAGRVLRIAAPLTLSRVSAGSAVHDPISGYGDRGYSIERLAYREARTRRMLSELLG
jgi:hypothetical protein